VFDSQRKDFLESMHWSDVWNHRSKLLTNLAMARFSSKWLNTWGLVL